MMKQVIVLSAAVLLLVGVASAQFTQEWETITDLGYWEESFNGVCPAGDGGVIAVGKQLDGGYYEAVFARVSSDGTLLWQDQIGIIGTQYWLNGVCPHPTQAGNFVAVGWYEWQDERKFWVLQFDANGTYVDDQVLNLVLEGGMLNHVEPDGNNLIACGTTGQPLYLDTDGIVVGISGNLTPLWWDTYGSSVQNQLHWITPTTDGGYIATGLYLNLIWKYPWTVKLTNTGSFLWVNTYDTYSNGESRSVIEADNGDYLICGSYNNGSSYQFMVIRTDSNGNELWGADFGSNTGSEKADWIGEAPGGGYYITGDGDSQFTDGDDLIVVHMAENGSMISNQVFSSPDDQLVNATCLVNSTDFVVAGENALGFGNSDPWVTRINATPPAPPLEAHIEALSPPVVIPGNGGSFGYSVAATNNTNAGITFDAWLQALHLSSSMSVEVRLFENVNLAANNSVSVNLNQFVPAAAPGGEYRFSLFLGDHPWDYQVFDSFNFTKSGARADGADLSVFDQPELWVSRRTSMR